MLLILCIVSRNAKLHVVTEQVSKMLSSSASKSHSEVQLSTTTVATGRMHPRPVGMKPYVLAILPLDPGKCSLSTAVLVSLTARERRIRRVHFESMFYFFLH
jgi:hypothetical protein